MGCNRGRVTGKLNNGRKTGLLPITDKNEAAGVAVAAALAGA
jgi:hypothetical protein